MHAEETACADAARKRRAILAIMVPIALASLDTAIANTALPTIASDLRAAPAAAVWVINAYYAPAPGRLEGSENSLALLRSSM